MMLMNLLSQPVVLLALTIGAFLLGVNVHRSTGSSLANPTLIAVLLIGLALRVIGVQYPHYFGSVYLLQFLLGPATVALAIPLVQSLEHLRRGLIPTLAALLVGSIIGAVSAYGIVRLCGGDRVLALTMLPKSLTTPIALDVSQTIGGVPSLTAVFAIAAGILVAVVMPGFLRLLRIDDPSAAGLAAGTAGSGIATARVVTMGTVPAAFAGVAIGINGLLTSALAPFMARWMAHW